MRVRDVPAATGIVWSEMTSDAVAKMRRCHREDGGPPRPLAECTIGDAFCSEW